MTFPRSLRFFRFLCGTLALSVATGAACFWKRPIGPIPDAPPVPVAALRENVAFLADDARGGRGLGSPGLAEAARYLADGLREAGFAPGAPDGGYLQRFEVPVDIQVASAELALDGRPLERGSQFEAFLASGNGAGTAPVVFVGYGISDSHAGFDEYAGVDVEGRVVLVLDHRPERIGAGSEALKGHPSRFLSRAYKLGSARDRGAAAVLLAPSSPDPTGLPGGAGEEPANPTVQSVDLPALAISRDAAARIVAAAGGSSLDERQARIDQTGRPASALLPAIEVRYAVRIERHSGEIANVVAIRHGDDPNLAREAVVVGAHFDHLGRGRFGSLTPDRVGEVHNGADDNASGAAGLLALARLFGSSPPTRRSLVLVGFTGEEAGLLGSAHYVEAPALPLSDTVAMINLDMIGRMRDDELTVFGVESSPDFDPLVEAAAAGLGLEIRTAEGGYGPSDQTSFYARDVPVLFLFTGVHTEYHTPDDDLERLNLEGTADVVRLLYRLTRGLLEAPRRPELRRAESSPPGGAGPGYGPFLGTIPEFGGPPVRGVRLSGVRSGSPAESAGIRRGDVIVEFDGASVTTLEEFAALLFSSRPGQAVEIVILREGRRVNVRAVLGQRR